ncbi:hypothetical protein FRC03_000049 [Tulasnella sp. 419]|nr:hypothetical protein FRC03_000049 [Tulasnella sp. 419]
MSIPILRILQDYASTEDPSSISPSVRLRHTATTLTIFDKYPKASYHFLILPRINNDAGWTKERLTDLRTLLLKWDKSSAKELLKNLEAEAEEVKSMIKDEMRKSHGLSESSDGWGVNVGFHAVPSML